MQSVCKRTEFLNKFIGFFVDDLDIQGVKGGRVYASYGISTDGLIAIVRPDGYVGVVTPFDKVSVIDEYFKLYLNAPTVNYSG